MARRAICDMPGRNRPPPGLATARISSPQEWHQLAVVNDASGRGEFAPARPGAAGVGAAVEVQQAVGAARKIRRDAQPGAVREASHAPPTAVGDGHRRAPGHGRRRLSLGKADKGEQQTQDGEAATLWMA